MMLGVLASTGATCVQLPDQPDTIAPAIVLQTPTQNSVVNSTVQITADVQDNRSVAQVQFFADGVLKSTLQAGPWRFFWDSTQVGDGPRLLRLVATDVNDNTSTLDINVVVQNGNTPLAPVISTSSVAPQSLVYAGSPVTVNYTATATDPDGGNVTYRWSFGDGTADASTASGAHSYSAVGPNYHLALTVTDNENQTTSKEWNVVVSDLPILGNIIHFNLLDQDGNTVKTADLAGKVVGVNFWATWCLPCRQEFPDLEEAYTLFGAQGYVMVGVDSFDLSQPSELKAWRLTNTLLTYPLVLDVGADYGDTLGAYSAVFGDHTNTLPQTAVADRNGKVRFYKIGRLASGELPAVLAKLVPFAP